MKYIYWISAVAVVAAGLYFALNVKVQPEGLTKIKYTQVQTPEEFGKMVLQDLKLEIRESPVIFLGVTPNHIEDMELWRGFLEMNLEAGHMYDVVLMEPMLPYIEIFNVGMRIDMKEEMARLAEGIKKARLANLRVAVVVPSIYSTHLLKNNPYNRLKEEYQIEGLSISIAKFPVTKEQEQSFEPRCIVDGANARDSSGTGSLGCAILHGARKTYKEKIDNGKYSGLMEQTGAKDYLILFNRNPNSK